LQAGQRRLVRLGQSRFFLRPGGTAEQSQKKTQLGTPISDHLKGVHRQLSCSGQPAVPAGAQEKSTLPEAYKAALTRLQELTVYPEAEWRYHTDVAHPEDPSLSDSDWEQMKEGDAWKTGARALRRWMNPSNYNGYDVRGARVELDLRFESQDAIIITVFSNRSQVARTDEDLQQPIPLTESAVRARNSWWRLELTQMP